MLLVNISLANGGLERQLLLLARNLPATWEARLWTIEGGPYEHAFRGAGVAWTDHPRRWRYDPVPALDLWRVMDSWRPDLVHAWHWMPAAAALPACLILGTPLLDGSIRTGRVPDARAGLRRGVMRRATLVVANSQAGLNAFGVGVDKGRVIYNAFDEARLGAHAPPGSASLGGSNRFTVIMAARMSRQKDFDSVLAAARLLERDAPGSWSFLLVGDGEDRARLLASAADLVATGAVTFSDAGLEAIHSIQSAQVGVLMTAARVCAEGCPNSIMEYMACGLPVVCSDSGGSGELVRQGQEGYVIEPYDAAALAERLAELRARPELRRRMGAAGRGRIESEFTVGRMVAKYLRAYEEAVGR